MDLYKIGFLTVRLIDVFDVLIVSIFFYQLIFFLRGTRAVQMLFGVVILVIFSMFSSWAQFKGLSWIMSKVATVGVVLFIVLFQPEIRRTLMKIGQYRLKEYFIKEVVIVPVNEIVRGVAAIMERNLGALILVEKHEGIKTIIENGVLLDSEISAEILETIFFNKTPLHDGAVVIQGNKIKAAGCVLPIDQDLSADHRSLGMRHKAGLSMSQESNVISIIISEETGRVSIAFQGHLEKDVDIKILARKIRGYLSIFSKADNA